MTPKQIRQEFAKALTAMHTAAWMYKIAVEPYSKTDGGIQATNTNGCKWSVYYTVTDSGIVWNEWEVELPNVPDNGKEE